MSLKRFKFGIPDPLRRYKPFRVKRFLRPGNARVDLGNQPLALKAFFVVLRHELRGFNGPALRFEELYLDVGVGLFALLRAKQGLLGAFGLGLLQLLLGLDYRALRVLDFFLGVGASLRVLVWSGVAFLVGNRLEAG